MFQDAALEVSNKRLDNLNRDTVISQLGMDSVAVMELVSYFEEKLSLRLPDEDSRASTPWAICAPWWSGSRRTKVAA